MLDLDYLNEKNRENNSKLFTESDLEYPDIKENGSYLLDENGNKIGTKGDRNAKVIMDKILKEGCWDKNPRTHYADGTKAYTLSLNNKVNWTYDLSKKESPILTLRPIAVKSGIKEIFWIYQDQSSDLDLLKNKYGITWWDSWALKDENGNNLHTIGSTYGNIICDYDQIDDLISGLKNNPDGRRHIIDMWQFESFNKPHGLKPCAYSTVWNVRHGRDGIDYLDMKLIQRSSDFMVAGSINQIQYIALQEMIAKCCGYTPGTFTWDVENIQIYDRHIKNAVEELRRKPIDCKPYLVVDSRESNFYKLRPDDIVLKDYPREKIREKNPQQKFDLGI